MTSIFIAYILLIFPIRSCLKYSQDFDNTVESRAAIDTPLVKVSSGTPTIYRYPKENKTEMLGYLKDNIRYDSLFMEMKRTAKSRNGFVFISFRYKHWFYFYDRKNINLKGAWLHTYWIKPENQGILTYIKHLRYNKDANFPSFYKK